MVTLTQDNSGQTGNVVSNIYSDDAGKFFGVLRNDTGTRVTFSNVTVLTYLMGSGNDLLTVDGDALAYGTSGLNVAGGAGEDTLSADFSAETARMFVNGDVISSDNVAFSGFEVFRSLSLGQGDDSVALANRRAQESLVGGAGRDELSIDNSMQTTGVSSSVTMSIDVVSGRFYNSAGTYTRFSEFEVIDYLMGSGNDTLRIDGGVTADSDLLSIDGGDGTDSLIASLEQLYGAVSVVDDALVHRGIAITGFESYRLALGGDDDAVNFSGKGFKGDVVFGDGDDSLSAFDRTGVETFDGGDGFDSLSIDNSMQTKGVSSTVSVVTGWSGSSFSGRLYNSGGAHTGFSDFEVVDYRMGSGNDTLRIDEGAATADTGLMSVDGGGGVDKLMATLVARMSDIRVDDGVLTADHLEATGFEAYDLRLGFGNDTVNFSGSGFKGNVALGLGDDSLSAVNRTSLETFDGDIGFDALSIDNSAQAKGVSSTVTLSGDSYSGRLQNSAGGATVFSDFEEVRYRMGNGSDTLLFEIDGMNDLAARLARLSSEFEAHGAATSDTGLLSIDGGGGKDYFAAMLAQVDAEISLFDNVLSGGGLSVTNFENYNLALGGGHDTVVFSGSGFKGDITLGAGDDRLSAFNRTGSEAFDGGDGFDTLSIDNSGQARGVNASITATHDNYSGRLYNSGGAHTAFSAFEEVSYLMGRGNDTLTIEDAGFSADSTLLSVDGGGGVDKLTASLASFGSQNETRVDDSVLSVGHFEATGFEVYDLTLGDGNDTVNFSGSAFKGNVVFGYGDDSLSAVNRTVSETFDGGEGFDVFRIDNSTQTKGGSSSLGINWEGFSGRFHTAGGGVTEFHNFEVVSYRMGSGNDVFRIGEEGGVTSDTSLLSLYEDWSVTVDGGLGNDTLLLDLTTQYGMVLVARSTGLALGASSFTGFENYELLFGIGDDMVVTGGGRDYISGGFGSDTMVGGAGNDTYVVDRVEDVVTELSGGGKDLVLAEVSYSLTGKWIENLTLTGTNDIDGVGSSVANVMTGNTGINVLTGGLGNDTYYVQNTGDKVVELAGEGVDVIYSTVSYSLSGRYAETIILTGSANANATGNSLANTLSGNDGRNTLNGKGGADTLSGGLGADVFLFEAGSGADTVTDFSAAQNDSLNVRAYTGGVANSGMVTQSGLDVLITLGGGNVITVLNAVEADVLAHMVW